MITTQIAKRCTTQFSALWRTNILRRYLALETERKECDVVIVGAGMVGAGLAASLSSDPVTAGLKIALVEAKMPVNKLDEEASETVPEMRVSTLTPASVDLVQKCGAWEYLAPPNSAAVEHMQVWDYGSSGCLRWSAQEVGHPNMGIVAENSLIQSAFLKRLSTKENVDFICPAQIISVKLPTSVKKGEFFDSELASLKLTNGQELTTRLVIGADGASSRIRQLAGLHCSGHDYGQRGLVATVEVSENEKIAWQRFLPTGPIALLPVRNGYFNIVWSTTSQMAEAVESADTESAINALNEALHGGHQEEPVLSRFTEEPSNFQSPPSIVNIVGGHPRSFPLKRQFAHNFVSARLALVGDAYRVVHPLAGQGVNLGFGDIHQLTLALNRAVASGQDIGDIIMLRNAYESQRRVESKVMMAALDGIREMFRIQVSPFQRLRGIGMESLNLFKPMKNEIMLYAMGLKPALAHIPFKT